MLKRNYRREVNFMIIRSIDHWDDFAGFNGIVVNGVSFLDLKQIALVYKACGGNKEMLCDLFHRVGIKFDDINILQEDYISYCVNGKMLPLSKLSSGERFILYLIACKVTDTSVLAVGLLERLGDQLMDVVYKELKDYNNLIILWVNASYNKKFRQYWRD